MGKIVNGSVNLAIFTIIASLLKLTCISDTESNLKGNTLMFRVEKPRSAQPERISIHLQSPSFNRTVETQWDSPKVKFEGVPVGEFELFTDAFKGNEKILDGGNIVTVKANATTTVKLKLRSVLTPHRLTPTEETIFSMAFSQTQFNTETAFWNSYPMSGEALFEPNNNDGRVRANMVWGSNNFYMMFAINDDMFVGGRCHLGELLNDVLVIFLASHSSVESAIENNNSKTIVSFYKLEFLIGGDNPINNIVSLKSFGTINSIDITKKISELTNEPIKIKIITSDQNPKLRIVEIRIAKQLFNLNAKNGNRLAISMQYRDKDGNDPVKTLHWPENWDNLLIDDIDSWGNLEFLN